MDFAPRAPDVETASALWNLRNNLAPFSYQEIRSGITDTDLSNTLRPSIVKNLRVFETTRGPDGNDTFKLTKDQKLNPHKETVITHGVTYEPFQTLWDRVSDGSITWEAYDVWCAEIEKIFDELKTRGVEGPWGDVGYINRA